MPRNNELPSYESLLEFQEVYLRAVALAWGETEDAKVFKERFISDPALALQEYFGYTCPWGGVDLSVEEVDADQYGWDSESRSWNLPKNTVGIGIPCKPDDDEQTVALAAYNDAGPTYLFTCC